ncbi:MAG: hypothetical protein AAFW81_06190 [Pseudomonadota bacterium]
MTLTTEFACCVDRVWNEVHRPELLQWIAAPILRFTPVEPRRWPNRWTPGRYRARLWAFGFVPLGGQWVGIEYPEGPDIVDGRGVLRDNGSGALIRTWDHWIFIEDLGDGRTRYTDRLDVEAGLITPFAWLFARLFYGHRQRRWKQLIAKDFSPLEKNNE